MCLSCLYHPLTTFFVTFFFFKQKTEYHMRISDWSSDVCSSDLKRIILIDGRPAGAINRVPARGEARSNMHAGGRPEKAELTRRELEICEAIGPALKERGLIFVGIDVIGDYMTEINVNIGQAACRGSVCHVVLI